MILEYFSLARSLARQVEWLYYMARVDQIPTNLAT